MDRYVWKLETPEKEELIEAASFPFRRKSDFLERIGLDRTSIDAHLEGEADAISASAAVKMVEAVEEGLAELEEPEEHIQDRYTHVGEERVVLEDSFQQELMKYYSTAELQELTGKSEPVCVKWRNNQVKGVPEESYWTIVEDARERLELEAEPEGELHLRGNHNNGFSRKEDSLLVEKAGTEELEMVEELGPKLEWMDERMPGYMTFVRKNAGEGLDKIYENLDRGSFYVKSESQGEGRFFKALELLGFAERWGGQSSPFELKAGAGVFRAFEHELERFREDDSKPVVYQDESLVELLRHEAEKKEEAPTQGYFDDDPSLPSAQTYHNHFGSWNNALWRAGLEAPHEKYSEEELIARLLDKSRDIGGLAPRPSEVDEDDEMPNSSVYRNRFGSYSEALEEAGISQLYRDAVEDGDRWVDFMAEPMPEPGYMMADD